MRDTRGAGRTDAEDEHRHRHAAAKVAGRLECVGGHRGEECRVS